MIGINSVYPQVPISNAYANGHPAKKRRSTAGTGPRPLAATVSSSTAVVPDVSEKIPIESSATNDSFAKPQDHPTPSNTTNRPFTPPTGSSNVMFPFSPNFSFSPLPQIPNFDPASTPHPDDPNHPNPSATDDDAPTNAYDTMLNMPTPYEQQPTPGAASASGSAQTDGDKDPFLSLLEQLAENEVSRGGPSELDFFLSGQGG